MRIVKKILCTFAAIWLPIVMFSGFFGLDRFGEALATLGEWPLYVMIAGLIWIIIDLWQSPKTQDEKIWWTALGTFFSPVVVPAYWFGFGIRRHSQTLDADQGGALNEGHRAPRSNS